VPWTNNSSEQALKGPKRHQAVSGYWHTTTTLADYCRVRSYLVSARGHTASAPSKPSTPPLPANPGYRCP
jgi:transposase